ncbi:chitobiase/beta-hexosaminidase C-terminal domain-containing protein, partial [Paenibacillus sepulcri]|nr:chitobiase/beta-hexosaminidase C-terminal domain-containing protein [Paenibacillus sepulcri]
KQMLKANTAYYEADGKRVSGSAAESAGMTSRELAGGSLPAKLNAGVWRGVPGFFPQLAAFNASDASKLSTAAVILDGQDTINSIRNGFELTQGDEMTWSADPKEVSLQPVSGSLEGSLKTSGSAVLTVTLDGAARSFMLNAPAPRFAESAQAPTADSESETFTDKAAVSLSTVEPAGTIYYTLDGSEPDGRSRLYTGPIVLMDTTTIKAVTIAEDKEDSEVFSGTWTKKESFGWFVFFPPPAPQPAVTASIGSKKVQMDGKTAVTMARNSKLTLSVPEGQMIYYTTDGSSPTKDSKLYKGDILVTKNMTIKFITDSDDKVITINCVVENAKYELKSDAKDVKYISGYNSRQFKPDTALTRYEITEILSQLLDKEDVAVANVFSDVDRSKEDLVAFFTSAGILSGYPDNTFRGKNGLTRAEFVVILSRVLNLNVSQGGKSEFSDAASHWAKNYIAAFAKAGYIQGFPDGTFKPDSKLTRAQAVVLINNIIGRGKQQTAGHKYDDVPSRHWAYSAIMSAVKE